jgi:hypothetical protein
MHYYSALESHEESYELRMGRPDTMSAAIGYTVLELADPDAQLSSTLRRLLEHDEHWNQLLKAALSFEEEVGAPEDCNPFQSITLSTT